MSQISRINPRVAKLDPEANFDSPQSIAVQAGLTRAEKLTALRRWRDQVQRRLDSAAEGMAPAPTLCEIEGRCADPVAFDSELLRMIELQLDAVEHGDHR